jgi:fibronectin-binding autotransporter adhesin
MVLSGLNFYDGGTTVSAGTLVAGTTDGQAIPATTGANALAATANAAGAFGKPATTLTLGDANTPVSSTPTVLIGGAYTVGHPITVASQANATDTIGGSTDNNATFSGAITLNQGLTISQVANAGANTLTISGGIAGAGSGTKTLTFAGPGNMTVTTAVIANGTGGGNVAVNVTGGTLTLSTTGNTYTGNTTIGASGILTGTGSLTGAGTVTVNGTLTPGSGSSGTLTLSSSPTLNGTLKFGINKTAPSTLANSQLALGANAVTFGGALTVTLAGGATALASGDSFTLVTSSHASPAFGGGFSSATLPALSSGLSWDTNNLATTGVLDVYTFTTTPLSFSTAASTAATVPASKVAARASGQAAAYATGYTPTANGGTVVINGDYSVTYTPSSAANTAGSDSFNLIVQDGHGSQTMAVSVTVNASNVGPTLSLGNGYSSNGGYGSFTASGIPGTTYIVQLSTDMSNWADYATTTALSNGLVDYVDSVSISGHGGTVFYRLKQQ